MTSETINQDAGVIYVMHDFVAQKDSPSMEYANDRLAKLVCENKLKFPEWAQNGDWQLIRIGIRKGRDITPMPPEVVWSYKKPEG